MYYIIYKTTFIPTGQIYVGVHKQESNPYDFDGYLGSGIILQSLIDKCGTSFFKRETLHVYDNPDECYYNESRIVTEEFVKHPLTFNVICGGTKGRSELDCQIISKRTSHTLQSKKAAGIQLGRPQKLSEIDIFQIQMSVESGTSITQIAKEYNVSRTTIYKILS